jgi:hypothetical protein
MRIRDVPPGVLVYVNKLAMAVVGSPALGFTTSTAMFTMGQKNEMDASMRSSVRFRRGKGCDV